jgi:hypothetical protein
MCVSDLRSVVPSGVYKWSINPISKPYPVYSHTPLYDLIISTILKTNVRPWKLYLAHEVYGTVLNNTT